MNRRFDEATAAYLQAVRENNPTGNPVYLVGGAVRDLLVGKPVKDLDFVVREGSVELSRAVRKKLHAVGFTLDDERATSRVIIHQGLPDEAVLDIASFSGPTLEADLAMRDFTVNAMAIALDDPDTLIDPLGGRQDLEERVLRAASPQSMELDPLRVLRGVRLARAYDLTIDPQTEQLLRVASADLTRVSGERIRDELFKILSLPDRAVSLRLLDTFGILDVVLPGTAELKKQGAVPPHVHSLFDHTLKTVEYLECFVEMIHTGRNPLPDNPYFARAFERLREYLPGLSEMLRKPIQGGRSRESLLYLAAYYHDTGKPRARFVDTQGRTRFNEHPKYSEVLVGELADHLLLGRAERDYLARLVFQHMRLHFLAKPGEQISRRAIYRYFKALGEFGSDTALLSMADTLSVKEDTQSMEDWELELRASAGMIEEWFARPGFAIHPQKWIDGNDLQRELGVKPGPVFGDLLDSLEEAQATGKVTSRQEAIDYARNFLASHGVKGVL